ncbi:hypothetical protein [Dyadobacter pollutisoli]|jgi:hypothetical protein|uniref:DUF642 domain-containing protein n=1 Tax=Dyadobacter pollutisoli TaxID=2910158 RepID=A0A9E8SL31_9BACT|nr:hypothetical protein [Dyadobacter pollutisoli]WAC11386.1 hypothetical protein ON006_27095 [Dyadobacter pollutisoli]
MKLVQKLQIGLAIACMMFASCSKDDLQTPTPQTESVNTSSNLRVDVDAPPPFISSTKGFTGINILPANWVRNVVGGYSNNQQAYPAGVSDRFRLWGNPSIPFVQSLSVIPGATSIGSFVTVTTRGILDKSNKSSVKTKIYNLSVGKKYALKVYVSSTLPKGDPAEYSPTFAKKALLTVSNQAVSQETVVDLTNYKFCWVEKIVTFTALSPQMDFAFSASPQYPGQYACAHLFVGYGAIEKLN